MEKIKARSYQELLRRYVAFVFVLFIIAFGTSLSIRANLGSSPISCPPYVLSRIPYTKYSMGFYVFCMHIFFVLSQIAMLRKNFKKIQLLQLGVSLLFGVYTDLTMWITSFIQFDDSLLGYSLRWLQLIIGGSILAYGIALEVRCDVLLLPGEGFPLTISKVTHIDFGKVKICSDTGLVMVGIVFCLAFFGKWRWELICIGTLFSTFFVGYMVCKFSHNISWLDKIIIPNTESFEQPEPYLEKAKEPLVITISRQYGSGGHEIGEKLAKRLGCKLYDKKIIDKTAEELGLTYEYVSEKEQNISTGLLLELILTDKSVPKSMYLSTEDAIFVSQSSTIKQIAEQEDCIIIGRCANWILKDRPNCFKVFICSDMEFANKRVAEEHHISKEKAQIMINQTNKQRTNHYWEYTGERWTDARHYDLVINTSKIGIEEAVRLIDNMANSTPNLTLRA